MRRYLAVVCIAALVLAAAACGDDDGGGGGDGAAADLSSEEQAFADAWAATLSDSDDDSLRLEEDEAQCMGDAIMAEIGIAPFDDAGIAASDIDSAADEDESPGEVLGAGVITDVQADAIVAEWEDCVDLNEAFVELMAAEVDLDESGRECFLAGAEEGDLVTAGFKASLTHGDEPPEDVVTELVELMATCGGDGEGGGGVLVDSIAESLAADGRLNADQAQCLAQEMVDTIGIDRLLELGLSGGDFENATPEVQQEMAGAVLGAAEECDVPLSSLGG